LVYGERRWRAAQIAGIQKIPALIKQYAETDSLEIALIENIQREDLCAAEVSIAIRKLVALHGGNQDKVVRKIGKSKSYISQAMKMAAWVESHGGVAALQNLSWGDLREMAYSARQEEPTPQAHEPAAPPSPEKKKPQKPVVQVSQESMKMIRFLSGLSKVSAEPLRQFVVPASERALVLPKIDGAIEKMKQNLNALEETKRSITEAQ